MSRTAYARSLYDKVVARIAKTTEKPMTRTELDLIWIAIRYAVEIEDETEAARQARRQDD